MKKLFLSLILILTTATVAMAGGKDRGGGNSVEIEFKGIGATIASELQSVPQLGQLGISYADFQAMVNDVEIIPVTTDLILDGKKKEAINIPSKKQVQVDEANWNQLTDRRKQILVMHEILSLMGNEEEQDNYTVSSLFFSILDQPGVQTTLKSNRTCKREAMFAALDKQKSVDPQLDARYTVVSTEGVSLPGVDQDRQLVSVFVVSISDSRGTKKWLATADEFCQISSVVKAM